MPVDWRLEPLRRDHNRAGFGCGEVALDTYLARIKADGKLDQIARKHLGDRADSGVTERAR